MQTQTAATGCQQVLMAHLHLVPIAEFNPRLHVRRLNLQPHCTKCVHEKLHRGPSSAAVSLTRLTCSHINNRK